MADAAIGSHTGEMVPQGLFRLMGPLTTTMGRRNLRATAAALDRRLADRGWARPRSRQRGPTVRPGTQRTTKVDRGDRFSLRIAVT
jgi:hypothetical protein